MIGHLRNVDRVDVRRTFVIGYPYNFHGTGKQYGAVQNDGKRISFRDSFVVMSLILGDG